MNRALDPDVLRAVEAGLLVLVGGNSVSEVRIPKHRNGGDVETVLSGYFNDLATMAREIVAIDGTVPAVYCTLNAVDPQLLDRSPNRLTQAITATKAKDITCRTRVLIDLDPKRPAGTSSTDAQHQAALDRGRAIKAWLIERGVPAASIALVDSGNGAHVLIAVDMAPAGDGLVKQLLRTIAALFDDDVVQVDLAVCDLPRIAKVPGTWCAKGPNTIETPHRRSCILDAPEQLTAVATEIIERIAAAGPTDEVVRPVDHGQVRTPGAGPDRAAFLARWGVDWKNKRTTDEGLSVVDIPCPLNSTHGWDAWVGEAPSGKLSAGCQHVPCLTTWAELREHFEPARKAPAVARQTNVDPPEDVDDEVEDAGDYHLTDMGNADRFVRDHGDQVRYVHTWSKWIVWNGRYWRRDDTGQVYRLARQTLIKMYAEAAAETDPDKRARLAKWAAGSEAARRLTGMVDLAKSDAKVAITAAELDATDWLLNVQNGTIDLLNGTFREHRPEDMLTRCIPVDYDPAAKAPKWNLFLARVLNYDQELYDFLQRAVGYSLTGDTREQCFFLMHGAGGNGKTTFIETIKGALGEYGQAARFETFLAKRNDSIPNDIARMSGRRMITASEPSEGRRFSESLLKELTGGESIAARFMHSEFFDFRPTAKLWFSANHKPVIKGTDHAIWRRFRLIPFNVTIPESERILDLGDQLLDELPGILAWAVEGCKLWRAASLGSAGAVKDATAAYREEMDTLGDFLAEKCTLGPERTVQTTKLYETYKTWAKDTGQKEVLTQKAFTTRLKERPEGLINDKIKGVRTWSGIDVA